MYKVVEIFSSIEGEGKRTGELTTFIRLYGCNLRCSFCDTPYSYTDDGYYNMTCEQIVQEVKRRKNFNVTITGGEPLVHPNITELIEELLDQEEGFNINIETNGSVDTLPIRTKCGTENLFFTVDYKSISSKMNSYMKAENFKHLCKQDVVKFVVGNKEDLQDALDFIKSMRWTVGEFCNTIIGGSPQIYFSPVFGKIDMKDIVSFMKDNNIQGAKIQAQLHKIIWNSNERGV